MGRITESDAKVTGLLLRWGQGDHGALDQLIPLVHDELHRIARRCMAGERVGHSLQATALVNEAYVRLVKGKAVEWHDRAHFLAVSARVMRRILVDHARAKHYQKRGGNAAKVTLDEGLVVATEPGPDFVALDEALEALAKFDERKSRVVEMRFFGGLTRRRDGRRVESVARDGDGRLAAGQGLAEARNARRSFA